MTDTFDVMEALTWIVLAAGSAIPLILFLTAVSVLPIFAGFALGDRRRRGTGSRSGRTHSG